MKNILVTGANGQLGQDITKELHSRRIFYFPLDKNKCDITKIDEINKYVKEYNIDSIINCAAYTNVDKAEIENKMAFDINASGAKYLAIISKEYNIPLIHFSSAYVFDGNRNTPYKILDTTKPLNVYGRTKLTGENYIREINPKHFIIRLSWLFGSGENNYIKKVMNWSKDKSIVKIVDDQISSSGYTPDLAKGICDLIIKGDYGLYHLANYGYCSKYEWGKYILSKISWKGEIFPCKSDEFKTYAQRPLYSVLDSSMSYEIIGYKLPDWKNATDRYLSELNK